MRVCAQPPSNQAVLVFKGEPLKGGTVSHPVFRAAICRTAGEAGNLPQQASGLFRPDNNTEGLHYEIVFLTTDEDVDGMRIRNLTFTSLGSPTATAPA